MELCQVSIPNLFHKFLIFINVLKCILGKGKFYIISLLVSHTRILTRLELAFGRPSFLETFLTIIRDFFWCFVRMQFKVSPKVNSI